MTVNCSDRWCERVYELSVEKAKQHITHKVVRHRQAVWTQEFLICQLQVLEGDVEIKDGHLLDAFQVTLGRGVAKVSVVV